MNWLDCKLYSVLGIYWLMSVSVELPVIDWNSRDHLKELGDTIFNLSLPDFECHGDELGGGRGDMGDEIDWQTAVEDVWAYVDAVAESSETTRALLYSK